MSRSQQDSPTLDQQLRDMTVEQSANGALQKITTVNSATSAWVACCVAASRIDPGVGG
ncbi:hypothetical protein FDG2_6280 [Candidatus Protofrankia californiensis]|uniref:Uncharacterized protein n=1 Tax=Candidatus Protofrankia californiensis TaxID=1839754 RepID=A0A1C3PGN6_9ACTN|nr:hypothetical protein FDG2_6280 [Candidatus Protofrankia californiensis]